METEPLTDICAYYMIATRKPIERPHRADCGEHNKSLKPTLGNLSGSMVFRLPGCGRLVIRQGGLVLCYVYSRYDPLWGTWVVDSCQIQ